MTQEWAFLSWKSSSQWSISEQPTQPANQNGVQEITAKFTVYASVLITCIATIGDVEDRDSITIIGMNHSTTISVHSCFILFNLVSPKGLVMPTEFIVANQGDDIILQSNYTQSEIPIDVQYIWAHNITTICSDVDCSSGYTFDLTEDGEDGIIPIL